MEFLFAWIVIIVASTFKARSKVKLSISKIPDWEGRMTIVQGEKKD